jgi:hypothetical protein
MLWAQQLLPLVLLLHSKTMQLLVQQEATAACYFSSMFTILT